MEFLAEFDKVIKSTNSKPITIKEQPLPIGGHSGGGGGGSNTNDPKFIPTAIPNDLIPLGEPISIPTSVQPPSEPILKVKEGGKTYLFLHPTQLYHTKTTQQAIQLHTLRYAEWIQSQTIDFARIIAGLQGVPLESLLVTGFEDLLKLMQNTLPKSSDLPLLHNNYNMKNGTQTTALAGRIGGRESEEEEGSTSEEPKSSPEREARKFSRPKLNIDLGDTYNDKTVTQLLELVSLLKEFGSDVDALRAFKYVTQREQRYDASIVKWLTLPMNLGKVYFAPKLYAAVRRALSKTALINNFSANDELFAEILRSDLVMDFAELTSRLMNEASYNVRSGDKRKFEKVSLDKDIRELTLRMRRLSDGLPDIPATSQFDFQRV